MPLDQPLGPCAECGGPTRRFKRMSGRYVVRHVLHKDEGHQAQPMAQRAVQPRVGVAGDAEARV